MKKVEFENVLDVCCNKLIVEAKIALFRTSTQFENRVRELLDELTSSDKSFVINYSPHHPQAFPDIAMGEYGVEVKFTTQDTWRCIANSVLETQRIDSVKHIYIIYGKMGGIPSVQWAEWENSVIHVRTSHVPRFEIEMPNDKKLHIPLFKQMGIRYDDFRKLKMQEKMKYIRAYARKIHPDGRLWWVEDKEGGENHTTPAEARLYTNLPQEDKTRLRAEGDLLCPSIVKSGRTRNKYDDIVLYLLTYHGVICHQARDLFSAGSVANPQNDDKGGLYIERALKLIEQDMIEAAYRMNDALFVEYWNESVKPEKRIQRWLEKADELAKEWKPSDTLFLNYRNLKSKT